MKNTEKRLIAHLTMFWLNNKRAVITLAVGAVVAATGSVAAPYAPIIINAVCSTIGGCQ